MVSHAYQGMREVRIYETVTAVLGNPDGMRIAAHVGILSERHQAFADAIDAMPLSPNTYLQRWKAVLAYGQALAMAFPGQREWFFWRILQQRGWPNDELHRFAPALIDWSPDEGDFGTWPQPYYSLKLPNSAAVEAVPHVR